MCGITAYFTTDATSKDRSHQLKLSLGKLAHRGPDTVASRLLEQGNAGLDRGVIGQPIVREQRRREELHRGSHRVSNGSVFSVCLRVAWFTILLLVIPPE